MNSPLKINVGDIRQALPELSAGRSVLLSGTVYTARDAAHKRICALLDAGEELPFPIKDSVIYYAGPTPTPPGSVCGSFGPTTSSRMDIFAPRLIALGLAGMIGKGQRSAQVTDAMKKYGSVYFCAVGGAGALIAKSIASLEEIAFPELGCESVKRLCVRDFPLIVGIDALGGSLFAASR